MRVLHVIESLGVGGAERLLATLLPELRRLGDDVAVAVLRPPLDLQSTLEAAGISVIVLPRRRKWNLLAIAVDIARCARGRSADVVHAHLYFPAVTTALGRVLRLQRAATVVTFHNLAYAPGVNKAGPGLRLRKVLAAWAYPRGFDAMLGVSEAVASHYQQQLGLPAVAVLHNAVDLAVIASVRPSALRDPAAPMHLVLPGRLVPEKGHAGFLEALAELLRAGRALRVTFAGDGPLRVRLQAEIHRLGLSGVVSIAGHLAYPDLLQLLADADIVVMPSRSEGFGLTAVEAMALGRPVVASNVGGLSEVIEDGRCGLLVPSGAPAALAQAIARLLDDPELRSALGAAGRIRVETRFALPVIAERLRNVYRRVAPGAATASVVPS